MILGGLLGRHEAVAVGVVLDLVERMPRVLDENSFIRCLMRLNSLAWMAISSRFPACRASGLMDHIRALGSANRLPGAPAVSRTAPIDAAWPMQ